MIDNNKNINNNDSKNVSKPTFNNNTSSTFNNNKATDNKNKIIKIKNFNNKNKKNFNSSYQKSEFHSQTIQIKRVVKVVKGGRNFRFSAFVIAGNKKGKVGIGIGKAREIIIAIQKAKSEALKSLITVNINKNTDSIYHNVKVKYCSSMVSLIKANKGTGLIAGGSVRTLLELAGIKNIYSKAHYSRNKLNMAKATLNALKQVKSPEQYLSFIGRDN